MRLHIVFLSLLALPGVLHAQSADANPGPAADTIEIRSHYIGEPVTRFLRLEPDAREDVDVCRHNPSRVTCKELLDAVENGARTEISTMIVAGLDNPGEPETSIEFVIDGGKLVKLSMPVNDVAEILKKLGAPSSESAVPGENPPGAKWENHLSTWDAPGVYITLYQDNNPSVVDHRPLLELESTEEHARDEAAARPQTVQSQ